MNFIEAAIALQLGECFVNFLHTSANMDFVHRRIS